MDDIPDNIQRVLDNIEANCREKGHSWAKFPSGEKYCQACGVFDHREANQTGGRVMPDAQRKLAVIAQGKRG